MASPSNSQIQKIFFFGNEIPHIERGECFRRMFVHTRDQRFRLLAAFSDDATRVLKQELIALPRSMRDQVPHFESILHLAQYDDVHWGCLEVAINNVFLIIFQIGIFIG